LTVKIQPSSLQTDARRKRRTPLGSDISPSLSLNKVGTGARRKDLRPSSFLLRVNLLPVRGILSSQLRGGRIAYAPVLIEPGADPLTETNKFHRGMSLMSPINGRGWEMQSRPWLGAVKIKVI